MHALDRLSVLTAIALLLSQPAAAQSGGECRSALASEPKAFVAWGIAADTIDALRASYRKLSSASGLYPQLEICQADFPNAAFGRGRTTLPTVVFTVPLLMEMRGSSDELASVMAHELAHMELEHIETGRRAEIAFAEEGIEEYKDAVNSGVRSDVALRSARSTFRLRRNAFSRELETQADERGVGIAVSAGYDASIARQALTKIAQIEGAGAFDGTADHPATVKRIEDVAMIERNERYRKIAEAEMTSRDSHGLEATVEHWAREVPGSGAASFYGAVAAMLDHGDWIPQRFGEAVGDFYGEGGMRVFGQAHQIEGAYARLFLCVTQFREGDKAGALHCLNDLGDPTSIEVFKRVTGWRDFILLGRRSDAIRDGLYAARVGDGADQIYMTNCSQSAKELGLRPVRLWRPAPLGHATPEATGRLMYCDRTLCHCSPISDEATLQIEEVVSKVAR